MCHQMQKKKEVGVITRHVLKEKRMNSMEIHYYGSLIYYKRTNDFTLKVETGSGK